jgi:hypothetical protein
MSDAPDHESAREDAEAILDNLPTGADAEVTERLARCYLAAHERIAALEKLLPPDREAGGVGQGSWSVFAGKVVEERDAARERIAALEAIAQRVVYFWGTENAQDCQCCGFARGGGHDGGCIVGDAEALLTPNREDETP